MYESSTIEISRNALQNNLRFIRKRLNQGVRLCSVVKGNAYGHGLLEFVGLAMECGVDYFGVHAADEAYLLKNNLKTCPDIFIMGAVEGEAVKWAILEGVEFSVFDFDRLELAVLYGKELNMKAKIHIELETGMRRTGFAENEIDEVCRILDLNKEHLLLQGVFTHFAGAESQANQFRISAQILSFEAGYQKITNLGFQPVYKHSACSAALLNYPETQGNMVRVGILQYGFWPNKETHLRYTIDKNTNPELLKRIISWKTKVMSIKEVRKGSFIGYGTAYLAQKNMKIAIVPVGYSHGYSRSLSNVSNVLIRGKNAPVIGTVNVNSLTIDVSHMDEIVKGDEVVLIGKQKDKAITVKSFSEQTQVMNYELLSRLPINIPRVVVP